MGKLCQVIAVVATKKAKTTAAITNSYHVIQKANLFDGISRTYQPKDEDGDRQPAENKLIQVKVGGLLKEVREAMTDLFDVIATQDFANQKAVADVVVGGKKVLSSVPVTHLLFLEKQLKDIETFLGKLPTLDPSEVWNYQEASDQWATLPTETVRTRKIPKAFVKAAATKEHPAQVETFHEDVVAGYWKTIKFSGAIPAKEKNKMIERIHELQEAIIKAREEANSLEVKPEYVGKHIFDFILG